MLCATWLILTTALLYRAHLYRDLREPYAEDGSALILGALSSPWNLLAPVVDGVFVIPRFLATIATSLSLQQAPVILSLFSSATIAFVVIYGVLRSLTSIAPSFCQRIMISLVIAGGIGSLEVTGFAMCVAYVITLFLVLLALEEQPRHTALLAPLILTLSFSTNSSFTAAPLFFIRAFMTRSRSLAIYGLITIAPLPISLGLAKLSHSPHSLARLGVITEPLLSIVDRATFYLFVVPVGGGLLSEASYFWRYVVFVSSVLAFIWLWKGATTRAKLLCLGLAATTITYIAAHAFGRAYSMSGSLVDFRLTPSRFAFLLVPCVVIAWSTLILDQRRLSARTKNVFIGLIVAAQITTVTLQQRLSYSSSPIKSWARFSTELSGALNAPAGGDISPVSLNPVIHGEPWGVIQCDASDRRVVRCSGLKGNKDGVVYEIARSGLPAN